MVLLCKHIPHLNRISQQESSISTALLKSNISRLIPETYKKKNKHPYRNTSNSFQVQTDQSHNLKTDIPSRTTTELPNQPMIKFNRAVRNYY